MADDDGFTSVADNPAAQAAIDQILNEANEEKVGEKPEIKPPADGFVRLSGLSVTSEGTVLREAEIAELNGEAEERLDKASQSSDTMRWFNTLLDAGTVSVGSGSASRELLDSLLVGDREEIVLGIRKATYGDEVELALFCPQCREQFETVLSIDDIPRNPAKDEAIFDVPLRKGGKATVRLPNGADQTAYMSDPDLTDSERNSVLLSRVIKTLPMDGEDTLVAAFPSMVRELGVMDRRKILDEIDNRMPGPQYDKVEVEHECGTKIPAPIGLVPLFPGLL